ncbi:MAG TPA: hypothetical protein VM536_07155 [Chloroflexia bacterium]|nr:hypothetical protein [Chloroflexia bacterium]
MLRGMRTAIKYFTLGLLAGLLLAPRKGDETRAMLVDRGRDYVKELMSSGQQAASDLGHEAKDMARDAFKSEGRGYDSASSVQ